MNEVIERNLLVSCENKRNWLVLAGCLCLLLILVIFWNPSWKYPGISLVLLRIFS